eukprot:TRINITY_DN244_c0_g1_i1.p1 TRINITY_DN244_c0_g1~~TRINITY_DN244_c0_g1_i1.p1  ORF type:complete len:186 (-),score=11.99 TRINITY_DN244_c0_g1_i1:26-583(-)
MSGLPKLSLLIALFFSSLSLSSAAPPSLPQQWQATFVYSSSTVANRTGAYFYDKLNLNYRLDNLYSVVYLCPKEYFYDIIVNTKTCYGSKISSSQCETEGDLFSWLPNASGPNKQVVNGIPCSQWTYSTSSERFYYACFLSDGSPLQLKYSMSGPFSTSSQFIFGNWSIGPVNPDNFVPPPYCSK